MRLEVMDTPFGFKIINDAYNANPDSMRRGIEELARLRGKGRAIAVLGDMLELGEMSENEHVALGQFLAEKELDFVITRGRYGTDILRGVDGKIVGTFVESNEEAAEVLIRMAKPGDLVLIKGSRGMRMEDIIRRLFER
jgi:UDP-N-acetylmuramoyl-tripeptide--D-alanyl-D-alanine ligase